MTPEEIIMMIKDRLLSLYRVKDMNGKLKQTQLRIDELERLLEEIVERSEGNERK